MPVVSNAEASDDEELTVRWLSAEQLSSWLSFVRVLTWLPWSIDQQLQRDSKLKMVEYQVLAMLSESPARTMRNEHRDGPRGPAETR